ncbi:hypothetical protein GW17_00041919 [Ensete ventricosum]|nr:hypothetical protein GW17_00041919 [Ensete ventricosum]
MLPQKGQPSMTYSVDNLPHFSPESDQAPSGGRRPAPAPSASAHSLSDPDTFSSDSTDSLREQLRLVNQRIDDVRKTLRTKDERGESPLRGSPFVQEIHDALIPPNFPLPMLEAYDGSSDPTEQMATFHVSMTPSDVIMCRAFSTTLRGIARGWYSRLPPSFIHSFDQLTREFEGNFLSNARPKPTVVSLLRMRQKEEEYLSQYIAHFIDEVREKGLLKTPNPLRSRAEDRDRRRYYRFHRDYEHDTEKCYDLKNQIENLILHVHLDQYIMKPREPSLHQRVLWRGTRGLDPEAILGSPLNPRVNTRITARITNACVKHIMIDTGSFADILYLEAFHKLRMTNRNLVPITSTLTRFTGDTITSVGVATLPVTFDDEPRTKTLMFPTSARPGETKSDPQESRCRYLAATTIPKKGKKALVPDPREPHRLDTRPEPSEPILEVLLEKDHPERTVPVRLALPKDQRVQLIDFLKRHSDVFTWSMSDMLAIHPRIAQHQLNTTPGARPMQ